MSRRTEEEASVAGAEAFRGAVFGAAKVEAPPSLHPQFPATHISYKLPPKFDSTDAIAIAVGSHCWWSRRHRLLPFSYISRIDRAVQSVCYRAM